MPEDTREGTPEHSGTVRLGAAKLPAGSQPPTCNTVTSFRPVAPHKAPNSKLGPLHDLTGFWEGTGFGLIARPNFSSTNPNGIFLELSLLRETIEFTPIGSPIMNRGSVQGDIALYGVTYVHRVTDGVTGGALHIETGMWLNIPPTTEPAAGHTLARLATIPHGNSVCTVGFQQELVPDGLPTIPPANTVPFKIGDPAPQPGTKNPYPEYDLGAPNPFRTEPLPPSITQAIIDDPNAVLRSALQGQTLTHITRLITSTATAGGVNNIPFISKNAEAINLESVFAIENVKNSTADGEDFLQLQYSQTTLLNFNGMSFPHVTVGTLIKAF